MEISPVLSVATAYAEEFTQQLTTPQLNSIQTLIREESGRISDSTRAIMANAQLMGDSADIEKLHTVLRKQYEHHRARCILILQTAGIEKLHLLAELAFSDKHLQNILQDTEHTIKHAKQQLALTRQVLGGYIAPSFLNYIKKKIEISGIRKNLIRTIDSQIYFFLEERFNELTSALEILEGSSSGKSGDIC